MLEIDSSQDVRAEIPGNGLLAIAERQGKELEELFAQVASLAKKLSPIVPEEINEPHTEPPPKIFKSVLTSTFGQNTDRVVRLREALAILERSIDL